MTHQAGSTDPSSRTDDAFAQDNTDAARAAGNPLVDMLSLLGGVNPITVAGKVLETVVTMSAEMVQTVSTFNDTMLEMNRMVHRVNSLLDEIEGPVRQVVPLMEISLNQAKGTLKKVDAVLGQVGSLPSDVAKAVSTLGELASRLGPLAQFAESAGGLFGIKPSAG
jgi:ABC-type transporter Mla subunit MlaD